MLLVLAATFLLINNFFADMARRESRPRRLVFSLPIPKNLAQRHKVPVRPEVEKVIVAGFFSEWDPTDDDFRMRKDGDGRWSIRIPLEPGDNQYKFVVYIAGRDNPVWVHDMNADRNVEDSFGGLNSVYHIPDTARIATVVRLAILGAIGLVLLFFILEPFIFWILRRRFPFRYKLVASLLIIVLISNIVFIVAAFQQQRRLFRQDIIDGLNTVHLVLLGEGVDFTRLKDQKTLKKIGSSLKRFFWKARVRVEGNKHSNIQISLSDLAVLDTRFRLLLLSHRKENHELQQTRAAQYGFKNSGSFFRHGVLGLCIARARKQKIDNRLVTDRPVSRYRSHETPDNRHSTDLLGYSAFLYPIRQRGKLLGYYGGAIQVKLFGAMLTDLLWFNTWLGLLLLVLTLLLLLSAGRVITGYLMELTSWTKGIINGNFEEEKRIPSGDEIQSLAENFNSMRLSLRRSFQEIESVNEQLHIEAYIDRLTQLPNRQKLFLALKETTCHALILFNVDAFQEINDFFGNEVGDLILVEIAHRLTALAGRYNMVLYRVGSDDFVCTISEPMSSGELDAVSIAFCDGIMDHPFEYEENEIYISVTSGSARTDVVEQSLKQEIMDLLPRAEMALKQAKKKLLRHLVYDPGMEISREYEYNIQWTNKLKRAIKEDRIQPFFQPIVDTKSRKIEKYECLVRLLEKDGSVITPDQFLRVSKQARFYRFITRIMLEKSFAAFVNTDCEFAVNLSIEDILDQRTQRFLLDLLEKYSQLTQRLVFEIVETAEIENYETVQDFIALVKPYGCKIAIDDFGAGYSSFEHIMRLNIDYIKIDASLIRDMDSNDNSRIITRTISRFAGELGIKTIAEFVHSRAVFEKVLEYGIDYSQGYYFGKPEPLLVE